MASKEFPGFDGWSVAHDTQHQQFTFTKPMSGLPPHRHGAPRERLAVTVTYGATDPAIAYERGKQDAYEAEAEFCPADDKALVVERADKQRKKVLGAMVKRNLEAGAPVSYALERLTNAGFSTVETLAIIGEDKE